MAVFFANSSGVGLGFAATYVAFQQFFKGVNPPGTSFVVAFDETTNAATVADIELNPLTYTAPGGTLEKNGSPVALNANGADFSIQQTLLAGFTEAQIQGNIAALWAGTGTTAQTQMSIAAVLFILHAKGIL